MRPLPWLFVFVLTGGAAAADLSVIDGDTFDVDGIRVLIDNIDAPELQGARCDGELRLALKAAHRLAEILDRGGWTLTRSPRDPRDEDRYGRKPCRVTIGDRDIGVMLVAEGLARPWTGCRRGWC